MGSVCARPQRFSPRLGQRYGPLVANAVDHYKNEDVSTPFAPSSRSWFDDDLEIW